MCNPASNSAGSTLYEMVLVFPSESCALPAVPCCVEMANGVSISQHSSVDALLAAPRAVMFRCNARTAAGCNRNPATASKVLVVERGPMFVSNFVFGGAVLYWRWIDDTSGKGGLDGKLKCKQQARQQQIGRCKRHVV